jgi:hypothetical protein
MVRTHLDTAMRINGIRYMENSENNITQIFRGETTYRKIKAANGQKMMDAYQKLTEDHAWVGPIYDELSDFVRPVFGQGMRGLWSRAIRQRIPKDAEAGNSSRRRRAF